MNGHMPIPALLTCALALAGAAPSAADSRCRAPVASRSPSAGPIPTGERFYKPETVRQMAQVLVENQSAARRDLRGEFMRVRRDRGDYRPIATELGGPRLLAQLAGWMLNDKKDELPEKAYNAARDILFDIYGDLDVIEHEYVQRRFISQFAALYGSTGPHGDEFGRGTARMKADILAYLGSRVAEAERRKLPVVARETAKHLVLVLQSCEIESALRHLARAKSGRWENWDIQLDHLLAAPMIYKAYGADAALAQALARIGVDVGRSANRRGVSATAVKNQAYFLGKILAATDVALWVHVRKSRKDRASIEHGARIVRWTLSAIEHLSGKTVKPATAALRKGVDWLEKKEKAAELKAETKTYREIRSKLSRAVLVAVEREIGMAKTAGDDADRMDEFVRGFEKNLLEGRRMAIEEFEKGRGVKFEDWMRI